MPNLLILLMLLAVTPTLARCPQACNCTNPPRNCSACLISYFRTQSSDLVDCTCIEGFTEMRPLRDKCRPTNCSTYNEQGCMTCKDSEQVYTNTALNITICVCRPNFYQTGSTCSCLYDLKPTLYYKSVVNSYCKACPSECDCNSMGCYQCSKDTNRTLGAQGSLQVCSCNPPYAEISGGCRAYDGCSVIVQNGVKFLECSNTSHRQEISHGVWACKAPYTDVNGSCECVYPWVLDIFIVDSSELICACSSNLQPSAYYEYKGTCNICPNGCLCTDEGCHYCDFSQTYRLDWYSSRLNCPCEESFIEYQGKCYCVEPYYLNDASKCVCMDAIDNIQYYRNPNETNACYACPAGCTCGRMGCQSCEGSSLRSPLYGTYNDSNSQLYGYFTCNKCVESAIEVNGVCVCPPNTVFNSFLLVCECSNVPAVYFDQSDARKCVPCPKDCTCTANGCEVCASSTFRDVKQITLTGKYVCPCNPRYTEVDGLCSKCTYPHTRDTDGTCQCLGNWFRIYQPQENCACLSIRSPAAYYYNSIINQCFECPQGCSCNEYGCYSCLPDTLRTVTFFVSPQSTICPCRPSTFQINGQCTYCTENSKPVNGQCVHCDSCTTCAWFGCTSCNNNSHLVNITTTVICACNNAAFVNNNGTCECPIGTYLNTTDGCSVCPLYCQTCVNITKGVVICTSCKPNRFRMNAISDNCVCIAGYKEANPIQSYCCSVRCATCNLDGCLSCNSTMNRVLLGKKCVCADTFIESGQEACVCPSGTAERGGVCLVCPSMCRECFYNGSTSLIDCISCVVNLNRNTSDSHCSCLTGFTEAPTQMPYCIPLNCINYTDQGRCVTCLGSRQLTSDGLSCSCYAGSYDTHVNGVCSPCINVLENCLTCLNSFTCLSCNTTNGSVLISTVNGSFCRSKFLDTNRLVTQSSKGLYVQVLLSEIQAQYSIVKEITAVAYTVYPSLVSTSKPSFINLTITGFRLLASDVLLVIMENPPVHLSNQLINLKYTIMEYSSRNLGEFSGVDSIGSFKGVKNDSYVALDLICSAEELSVSTSTTYMIQTAVVGLCIVVALVLYLMGFKHNQFSFFLQTVCLLGYTIDNANFAIPKFLYSMRIIYYQYGEFSLMVPRDYMEPAVGNFSYFEHDSNILRIAAMTLVLATLNCITIAVLRLILFLKDNTLLRKVKCIRNISDFSKKTIYRLLEFIYKTCMYPLLFFAIINIRNWNVSMLVTSPNFRMFSLFLYATIVICYFLVSLWQWFGEITAKLSKIQNILEFGSALIASIILSMTVHSDTYLLLILVFCVRAIGYIWPRKVLLRDFNNIEYFKIATTMLEVATLCVVKTSNVSIITGLVCLTVTAQFTHEIVSLVLTKKKAQQEKAQVTEEKGDLSSIVLDSQIDVGKALYKT